MAYARPTVQDLIGFLKLQTPPNPATTAVYQEAIDDALEEIESRVSATFVKNAGFSLVAADNNYPGRLRFAVLLQGSRFAKRSSSPEGIGGLSEYGVAVRVLGVDPDIERSIRRFLKLDGFV